MKVYLLRYKEELGYQEIFLERERINIPESLNIRDNEIEENTNFEYRVVLPSEN